MKNQELEAVVVKFLELLSARDGAGIYEFTHPSVIASLSGVFDSFRLENESTLTDSEIFAQLYDEYSFDDFEDRNFDLIGEVVEGSDVAHVIVRLSGSAFPLEASWVETLSFAKHNGSWRPLLTTCAIANIATEYSKEIEQGGDGDAEEAV